MPHACTWRAAAYRLLKMQAAQQSSLEASARPRHPLSFSQPRGGCQPANTYRVGLLARRRQWAGKDPQSHVTTVISLYSVHHKKMARKSAIPGPRRFYFTKSAGTLLFSTSFLLYGIFCIFYLTHRFYASTVSMQHDLRPPRSDTGAEHKVVLELFTPQSLNDSITSSSRSIVENFGKADILDSSGGSLSDSSRSSRSSSSSSSSSSISSQSPERGVVDLASSGVGNPSTFGSSAMHSEELPAIPIPPVDELRYYEVCTFVSARPTYPACTFTPVLVTYDHTDSYGAGGVFGWNHFVG